MKHFLLSILIFCSLVVCAQSTWKNAKPYPDYWQQDVDYKIKARVDEQKLTVGGDLELIYTNNSPDTLYEVYFHLYQNAFQKGAYYHQLQLDNGVKPWYGLYQNSGLGTAVEKINANKGVDTVILDNTLLRVNLKNPLLPHESARFDIEFKTYWGSGSARKRMKAYYVEGRNIHFNGAHWYPRMAVYDAKFGWNTNQHLDKEFYGDFGTFEVELDFANDYIVEATGSLLNEQEVLPAELKERIQIKNFTHRGKGGEGDTLSIPVKRMKGKRKVWKYRAENVHDFAFTADPTYRIEEVQWGNKKTVAIAEERHCPKWTTAAQFAMDVIQVYSRDFGMYEYPKMVVADAEDGMEYPMITFDSGSEPYFKGLFAHEIAHNWFYGMIGTNETYRAFMDEGFTQFLTVWSLESLEGKIYTPYATPSKKWYLRKFRKAPETRDLRAYLGYFTAAIKNEDPALNTHSSDFDGGSLRHGGGYGQVYSKTAVMLYNLQYVLGDSLFLAAMQNYVREWKFKHPYPEDFRQSFIRFTKVDLNWFFDQWLETSKHIDYRVSKIKRLAGDTFNIKFKRTGAMQMPIDFVVRDFSDSLYSYHIPNTDFIKDATLNVLPKWYGWGKFNQNYEAQIIVPGGVRSVEIDTSRRLADINPLNNSTDLPVEVAFNPEIKQFLQTKYYELKVRPDVWWNRYDGVKVGANFQGDYMNLKHVFDASVWLNSGIGQGAFSDAIRIGQYDDVSFRVNYKNLLARWSPKLNLRFGASLLGGVHNYNFGMDKHSKNIKHRFGFNFKAIFRENSHQLNYALLPNEWNVGKLNSSLNLFYRRNYKFLKRSASLELKYRTAAFFSDYSYDAVSFENLYSKSIKKLKVKTRLFGQVGFGSNWAPESMLFLAGGNPESFNDNKFTRSSNVFSPNDAAFGDNINLLHVGGGLNLRGYSGYLAPESLNGTMINGYKGSSGFAFNVEVEFEDYLGINKSKLKKYFNVDLYAFGDAGILDKWTENAKKIVLAEPRIDAGFGMAINWTKFYHLEKMKPLTFRLDVPLFLNRTPSVSPEEVQFRYVIGVNRAF